MSIYPVEGSKQLIDQMSPPPGCVLSLIYRFFWDEELKMGTDPSPSIRSTQKLRLQQNSSKKAQVWRNMDSPPLPTFLTPTRWVWGSPPGGGSPGGPRDVRSGAPGGAPPGAVPVAGGPRSHLTGPRFVDAVDSCTIPPPSEAVTPPPGCRSLYPTCGVCELPTFLGRPGSSCGNALLGIFLGSVADRSCHGSLLDEIFLG